MYNRYIPQPDGTYRKDRMNNTPKNMPPPPPHHPAPEERPDETHEPPCREARDAGSFLKNLLPRDLDTGDLLIILLLLLMSGDSKENSSSALLTLALYLFL